MHLDSTKHFEGKISNMLLVVRSSMDDLKSTMLSFNRHLERIEAEHSKTDNLLKELNGLLPRKEGKVILTIEHFNTTKGRINHFQISASSNFQIISLLLQ
ncbi:hypothetical protein BH09BAC1_BH09BAC1_16500 [soil metagenome]